MTGKTTTDPVAASAAAREQGVEHLRQLRERQQQIQAARDAELGEIEGQLEAAEAEFAAAEAEKAKAEQLVAALEELEEARAEYDAACEKADALIDKVYAEAERVINLFVTAREVELARQESGDRLRRCADPVRALGGRANLPEFYGEALRTIEWTSPLIHIARGAVAMNPGNPVLRFVHLPPVR